METAVDAASRAFPAWAALTPEVICAKRVVFVNRQLIQVRAGFLLKIADRIDARLDQLALAESRDQVQNITCEENVKI